MKIAFRGIAGAWLAASLLLLLAACQPPNASNTTNRADVTSVAAKPSIEAAPTESGAGEYLMVAGDNFKLTVRAPQAQQVELFYQPVTAADRALKLKTLGASEDSNGEFVADLKIPEDFNGEVWARASYADGEKRETDHLLLARRDAFDERESNASNTNAANSNTAARNTASDDRAATSDREESADTDESPRADKFTGGRVDRAAFKAGDGNVKITVNVPAFTMTLWQSGREIGKYFVGVGRKNYPIPIGMRSANKIILNPNWIPPDSSWVRASGLEPYEKIPASDPDNPLGKIKIPLGQAYLLHEAQSPADLGNLVSHGCVRVLRDDLFAVTKMIAEARSLSVSKAEIEAARKNSERRVINLNGEIPVDINYDSIIVENGVLTIYPDVYERKTNTPENLRAELESYNVDVSKIDEKTLSAMLDKVSPDEKFVVALADIKAGRILEKGQVEPLTPQQAKGGEKKKPKK